jgi:hypothetical protein
MTDYRKCSVLGCGTVYTDGSMAYCGECHRDFCEEHAAELLVDYYEDYLCPECKARKQARLEREWRRVEYLRNIPPEEALTVEAYKARIIALERARHETHKYWKLLKECQEATKKVHGMVSGHNALMERLAAEAWERSRQSVELLREFVDCMALQWANGPYQDRIDEIRRWQQEEGRGYFDPQLFGR